MQSHLDLTTEEMQSFFRMILVPGLEHCNGGAGSWYIGQTAWLGGPLGPINPSLNNSNHNVLLALVEWTEGAQEPTSVIGTRFKSPQPQLTGPIESQRRKSRILTLVSSMAWFLILLPHLVHCVYPNVSRWNGVGDTKVASSWYCDDKAF